MFNKNDETIPTTTGTPSSLTIYFFDQFDTFDHTLYKYSTDPTDDILVDVISAYGNPIKMSFINQNGYYWFFIYVLMAGDFGKNIPAKIAKYRITYISETKEVPAQPVKFFEVELSSASNA